MRSKARLLFGVSIFWLGLSMLADGLNTLVLPSHLFTLTTEENRATTLGLLTFCGLVLGMMVQPVAGTVSDRLRHRWGRRGTVAVGVLLTLAALTAFAFSKTLMTVMISYSLIQVTANIAQAAQQGFLPDLVPMRWRGTSAGLKGFMDFSGALLGYAVLGPLLGNEGTRLAILATAIVLLITLLLTLLFVREPLQPAQPAPYRFSIREAFRIDLSQHRSFAWLIGSRFVFLLGSYAVIRFFLFFVAHRLNIDPDTAAEEAGALLAGLTLVTILAAPLTGWMADRWGRVRLMVGGAAFSALGVLLLILSKSNLEILFYSGIMAIGTAAFTGANWALTADLVPPSEGARFFGLANIGTAGAVAAAGLLGPIVDWANGIRTGTGYSVVFAISALAFVASIAFLRRVVVVPEPVAASQLSEV
jgi:MFS family permease